MTKLQGPPSRRVEVSEVPPAVYKIKATDTLRQQIEQTGTDADTLMVEIKAAATRMDSEIEEKIFLRFLPEIAVRQQSSQLIKDNPLTTPGTSFSGYLLSFFSAPTDSHPFA